MSEPDPVMKRLAELPVFEPSAALSGKVLAQGRRRLVPARLHPLWGVAVAASVVAYLGWALVFTGQLF